MFAAALITTVLLFAGWFALLYPFHRTLQTLDPALSPEIGEPSWFWTAFNGHSHLRGLMRRPDLAHSRYAPLAGQALLLRCWALALLAAMAWVAWQYQRLPLA